ncbi:MAG TPA: hypothetical protein VGX68_17460 [Thermoanaerobaculia bacterium]|jgi:hypothetical protein|nr:hypothetical protein [Thermoanaerobaculia bacterium]
MSWASKPSYPHDALNTLTIRATDRQLANWTMEAKRTGRARGAAIAYLADLGCTFLQAWRDTNYDWACAMEQGPITKHD